MAGGFLSQRTCVFFDETSWPNQETVLNEHSVIGCDWPLFSTMVTDSNLYVVAIYHIAHNWIPSEKWCPKWPNASSFIYLLWCGARLSVTTIFDNCRQETRISTEYCIRNKNNNLINSILCMCVNECKDNLQFWSYLIFSVQYVLVNIMVIRIQSLSFPTSHFVYYAEGTLYYAVSCNANSLRNTDISSPWPSYGNVLRVQ